jgi:hypothetical protein
MNDLKILTFLNIFEIIKILLKNLIMKLNIKINNFIILYWVYIQL